MIKYIIALFLISCPALAGGTSAGTGTSNATIPLQMPTSTVGALPACATGLRGQMYIVTDALLPVTIANVAAGGAVVVGVLCNGTNWIVL